jgi:Putative zinc-finger
MECRNFKELLDSYLSDELAVESNHQIIRHSEICPNCRSEMAARRNMRSMLRESFKVTTASPDFKNRLRASLREEANPIVPTIEKISLWNRLLSSFATQKLAFASAIFIAVAAGAFYIFQPTKVEAAELSPQLFSQAAGDHDYCSAKWLQYQNPVTEMFGTDSIDPEFKNLPQLSQHQALGLTLHHAHVCTQEGRLFAHLVYTRGADMISLLITERNSAALKNGIIPNDNGLKDGIQNAFKIKEKYTISAIQTSKHIILIVSSLDETSNKQLAEKLAQPISQHLRLMSK